MRRWPAGPLSLQRRGSGSGGPDPQANSVIHSGVDRVAVVRHRGADVHDPLASLIQVAAVGVQGGDVEVVLDPGHAVEVVEEGPGLHVALAEQSGEDDLGLLVLALDRVVGDPKQPAVLRLWTIGAGANHPSDWARSRSARTGPAAAWRPGNPAGTRWPSSCPRARSAPPPPWRKSAHACSSAALSSGGRVSSPVPTQSGVPYRNGTGRIPREANPPTTRSYSLQSKEPPGLAAPSAREAASRSVRILASLIPWRS